MSKSVYYSPYECDCGMDYGSCEAKCAYALVYNGSCDISTIMHKDGHRDSDGTWKYYETLSDNQLSALSKLLNSREEITGEVRVEILEAWKSK